MRSPALSRAAAHTAAQRVAARLADDRRVRLVYLYGSTVDAARREVGDVDLAVACAPRLPFAALMALRADAVAAAGVHVDLVDLEDVGVVLAWEVAETGRCLFVRDPEDDVAFVTRARTRYWDFKPYLDEQWRLAGERLAERRRGPAT